jgi:hypothetical protein
MPLEKILKLPQDTTKPSHESYQISSFDLPYKKHFLIDLIGTILLIKDYHYKIRDGVFEFLDYYKQQGIILSLQSDALRLKNPKKEYKVTQDKLKEVYAIFKNIKHEINLDWLSFFDNIYDKTWRKKIKNPDEIKHYPKNQKFNYPLEIKNYKKMSDASNINLIDTAVIGDEPDVMMSEITRINYFPIKSKDYLNFQKLIR